jgi:hypothetical protein
MSSVFRTKNLQDTAIDNVFFLEKSCKKMYAIFSAVQRQQRKSDVMTSFGLTACSAVYYQVPHCRFLIVKISLAYSFSWTLPHPECVQEDDPAISSGGSYSTFCVFGFGPLVAKTRIRLNRNLVCELLLPSGFWSIALSWFSKMAAWAEIWQKCRWCLDTCSHKVRMFKVK